jgi:hypothetical protein
MTSLLARLAPTPAWVRLAIVPALAFIALAIDRQYLVDFWHHLARGQVMAHEGRLLNEDRFTFTVPGQSFQDVNWLTQVIYFQLFKLGALPLVRLVNALVVAATMLLLVLLCRRKCGSLGVAALVGVFTFLGLWQILTIRPQTFSLLLFVILYDVLDRAERRPSWLLLSPVLLALWVNLHGAFPAGLMLLGCFVLAAGWRAYRGRGCSEPDAGPRDRPPSLAHRTNSQKRQLILLTLCAAISTLATLANPYGWRVYEYVVQTSGRAADRGILEWLPPNLEMLIGMAWALSLGLLVVLSGLAWLRRRQRPHAWQVFLTLCFLPLACSSVRMVAWWLIVFAPILSVLLVQLLPAQAPAPDGNRPTWQAALMFSLVVMLAWASVPGLEKCNPLLGFGPRRCSTEEGLRVAGEYLMTRERGGRIFSRFEWGEYLAWSCAPRFQVFMDGRIEIYPDAVWDQYLRLTDGMEGWQKVLDAYGVDYLVLDAEYHGESGLLAQVQQAPDWRPTLRLEGGLALFERTALEGLALGNRRPLDPTRQHREVEP